MSSFRKSLRVLFSVCVAGLLATSSPRLAAQCFGPDNLDIGPCCAPTLPNLPPFPGASLPALGVCWNQCTVTNQNPLKLVWNTPAQPVCGEFTTTLTAFDGTSGLPVLTGNMVLDYTRTWNEVDPSGVNHQVWRFTAKADLAGVPGGIVPPCPAPNCIAPIGPHPTAFFYGYVDYTSCAAAGPWENTLVLYHACDRFIHMPGLSDKPGVFHPGGSYAIVAPHSAVQPFIPMNNIAAGGPVFGEATRDVRNVTPPVCVVEDHVQQAAMTKLGAGCVCLLSPAPKFQTLRDFKGTTFCPTTAGSPGGWAALNILWPTLPWFYMVSTSIGCWSNGNAYPGKECAWVDEGLFIHQSACSGDFVEIKYGGSTKDGWLALLPVPVVVTNFTDLADNYSAPTGGPFPTPIVGSIRPTDHLIYVNLP